MGILFSDHALLKLRQRNLSQEKVIQALEKPDYVVATYSDRKAAYKKLGKLYLKVIFIEDNADIIVVSQHWEEKFTPHAV